MGFMGFIGFIGFKGFTGFTGLSGFLLPPAKQGLGVGPEGFCSPPCVAVVG